MAAGVVRSSSVLLAVLFIASGVVADVTLTGVYDLDDIRMIDLGRTSFNLTCRVEQPTSTPMNVIWFKEKAPVSNTTLQNRYQLTNPNQKNDYILNIKPVHEDDYGNYTCKLKDQDVSASFKVYGKPYVRLHPNQNVVEGQKIKIICTVLGKPYPIISWMYNNDTVDATKNVTLEASDRISFANNEAGVENAVLVLIDAVPGDYGKYYCQANSLAGNYTHVAGTTLRVKDKYAALWPFIGICAEVIVLCAIILVYEKRRSKSTDMEDSDTDNHDQKQPMGNKDTTGLHQRK